MTESGTKVKSKPVGPKELGHRGGGGGGGGGVHCEVGGPLARGPTADKRGLQHKALIKEARDQAGTGNPRDIGRRE